MQDMRHVQKFLVDVFHAGAGQHLHTTFGFFSIIGGTARPGVLPLLTGGSATELSVAGA
jgi:hypothetical protein